jgi:lysozyme
MEISEHGKEKIKEWEGSRARPYRDAGGKLTIGVGHLLTPSELASGNILIQGQPAPYAAGLSAPQILDLLGQDLAGAVQAVNQGVEVGLSQNQFDTLVSFCFNVGSTAFKNSTLLRLLNQGAYGEVPAQLRRWVRCHGEVAQGLVSRREQELELWQS